MFSVKKLACVLHMTVLVGANSVLHKWICLMCAPMTHITTDKPTVYLVIQI